MTKTMVSGLLTWLCGLIMLMVLIASIPQGSAEHQAASTSPAVEHETPVQDP